MEIAVGLGLTLGAGTFVARLREIGYVDPITYYMAASMAVCGFGFFYAVGVFFERVGPGIAAMRDKKEDRENQEPTATPSTPAHVTAPPEINLPAEEGDSQESEEPPQLTAFERRVLDDRRFRGPRGRVYETDGPVVMGILCQIGRARAAGKLDTISASQLTELGIISRHSPTPPNAESTIEDLLNWGMVVQGGERRPWQWTPAGRQLFPSPTDPASQIMGNGVHSATAATAAT